MEQEDHSGEDADLLRAAVADPAAFARFYRRHVRGVIAFFHRRTGDAETAADLTAETFAAALAGCHRYDPDVAVALAAFPTTSATPSARAFSTTARTRRSPPTSGSPPPPLASACRAASPRCAPT